MKIINICGARPNFMKIAPLARAYQQSSSIESLIVHTGQHYDERMSKSFFDDLQIPKPDINLEVGSGSHAQQTAAVMSKFEPVVLEHKPDAVLVVGDVNSTVACAMVAAKLGVGVFHVEAGLRSFDRTMPEEINRVLTDAISDLLFVSEPSGFENLKAEGVDEAKVHFVGNVMIDTLRFNLSKAEASTVLTDHGWSERGYVVLTLHRPSNVDDPRVFGRICDALDHIQRDVPVVFPIHPRTRNNIANLGLSGRFEAMPNVKLIEPLGYLDFLKLTSQAAAVLTDSGGIQEETTILGTPCLTLRENTERPVTITEGTNQLVGMDPARIMAAYDRIRDQSDAPPRTPEKWDGRAAERIVSVIEAWRPK
jgi:UDP-N-acetylglucosamine 2-epimerase (non-hydrolysing)